MQILLRDLFSHTHKKQTNITKRKNREISQAVIDGRKIHVQQLYADTINKMIEFYVYISTY